jgi:hypothetical protein
LKNPSNQTKRNPKLTKVVLIPTLSAAEKAKLKLRFLSVGVRVSYGILSGKYECKIAQKASPSFQDELKFVISMLR